MPPAREGDSALSGRRMPRPSLLAGESLVQPEPEPEPQRDTETEAETGTETETVAEYVSCWKGCYHATKFVLSLSLSVVTSGAAAVLIAACADPDFVLALAAEPLEPSRGAALDAARAAVLQLLELRPNRAFVGWARGALQRLPLALYAGAWRLLLWVEGPALSPPPSPCALMGLYDSPSRSHWTRSCAVACPRLETVAVEAAAALEPLVPLTEREALTGFLASLFVLVLTASAVMLLVTLIRCVHSTVALAISRALF